MTHKITPQHLYHFFENLALFLKEKIPLKVALQGIARSNGEAILDKKVSQIATSLLEQIDQGERFSIALSTAFPYADSFTIRLVEASEKSGSLEEGITLAKSYLKQRLHLQERLRKMMAYPLLLLGFFMVVVILLLVVTIPALEQLFSTLNREGSLPLWWKIVMFLSDTLRNPIFLFSALAVGSLTIGLLFSFSLRSRIKFILRSFLLTLPAFGKMHKLFGNVITLTTLATMVRAQLSLWGMIKVLEGAQDRHTQILVHALQDLASRGMGLGALWEYLPELRSEGKVLLEQSEKSGTLLSGLELLLEMEEKRLERYIEQVQFWLPTLLLGGIGVLVGGTILGLMSLLTHFNHASLLFIFP